MNPPKIQLSPEEIQLVQNAELLLTKNSIIERVYQLFGILSERMQNEMVALPEALLQSPPKISRGEKYLGLPYVMLDYPRYFGKEEVFALRTFFWWGHYFTVTLHLKGSCHQTLLPALLKHRQVLAKEGFRLCVGGEEWDHFVEDFNYTSFPVTANEGLLQEMAGKPFLKTASRIPFSRWNEILEILYRQQQLIYNLVKDQFPKR